MSIDTVTAERLSTWERDQIQRELDAAVSELESDVADLQETAISTVANVIDATDHLLSCEDPDTKDNVCWDCREARETFKKVEQEKWLTDSGVNVERTVHRLNVAVSKVLVE